MSVVAPAETKLRWFQRFGDLLRAILPAKFRRFVQNQLFGITPDVPVTLLGLSRDAPPIRALIAGSILAWIFCFAGSVLVSWLSGTLTGSDPARIYFVDDVPNLVNYLLLCPAYVGLSAAFIVLALQAWNRLRHGSLMLGSKPRLPRLPMAMAVFLILAASSVFTITYIAECLSQNVYAKAAWYIDLSSTGERTLNFAGIYYTVLNFCLLAASLTTFGFLAVLGCTAAEIGRILRGRQTSSLLKFERLQIVLTEFTWAYIFAKLLAAAYIANAFTWKWEHPEGSLNFRVMVFFLATLGVFVVSFPRYYVEIEWFHFKVRKAEALGVPMPREGDDLRVWWMRDIANILDLIFGVTCISSLVT